MDNPYVPPQDPDSLGDQTQIDARNVQFRGGYWAIAFIGAVLGIVGILYINVLENAPFALLGAVWLVAVLVVAFLIVSGNVSTSAKVLFVILAWPIGFAIYVPTCMGSAVGLNNAFPSITTQSPIIASAITMPAVLLLCSWRFRGVMGRRRLTDSSSKTEKP